jgi:hypothetical protein
MSLPGWYAQIERMIENTALQTKTARDIVRKADLHPRVDETIVALPEARTLIDVYLDLSYQHGAYQWVADLSSATHIRFVGMASGTLYLYYSPSGPTSSALDPGDYQRFPAANFTPFPDTPYDTPFVQSQFAASQMEQGLQWAEIAEEQKILMRLSVSTSDFTWIPTSGGVSSGGFSVGVQVK